MTITYHGHSCFKLKGTRGTVVMDPYTAMVGWSLPKLSADICTTSHAHPDHNAYQSVSGTARRERSFIIEQPGEYEVGGISVFGVMTQHDASHGTERGSNIVFTVLIDGVRVCHLGDLGHELTASQIEAIGSVDVLLCPVGGVFTIDQATAVKVIHSLEPSIVVPMHYRTDQHDPKIFAELATLEDFMKSYGAHPAPQPKLELTLSSLPEETELAVLVQV